MLAKKKKQISVASAKQKGRLAQQLVVAKILQTFPFLSERDVKSVPGGTPGVDVVLSEAAVKVFPYNVETKCQEKLAIWEALKQAESRKGATPILVFKRNRSEVYCALKFDDFMAVLQSNIHLRSSLLDCENILVKEPLI